MSMSLIIQSRVTQKQKEKLDLGCESGGHKDRRMDRKRKDEDGETLRSETAKDKETSKNFGRLREG